VPCASAVSPGAEGVHRIAVAGHRVVGLVPAYDGSQPSSLVGDGQVGLGPAGAYGRAYLEKLIQIQLRLPPPLLKDLRKMLVPVAGERLAFPPEVDALTPEVLRLKTQTASPRIRWWIWVVVPVSVALIITPIFLAR